MSKSRQRILDLNEPPKEGGETYILQLEKTHLPPPPDFHPDPKTLCELALQNRKVQGKESVEPLTHEELKHAETSLRRAAAVELESKLEAMARQERGDYLRRRRHQLQETELKRGRIDYSRACMIYTGMTHHPDRAVEKVRAHLSLRWIQAVLKTQRRELIQWMADRFLTDGFGGIVFMEEIGGTLTLDMFADLGVLLEGDNAFPEARVPSAVVGNAPESRSQAQVKRAEKRRVKPGAPPKKQPISKAANRTNNTDKRERRRSRC